MFAFVAIPIVRRFSNVLVDPVFMRRSKVSSSE